MALSVPKAPGVSQMLKDGARNFREQGIDGAGLPLLTEDHLMNSLGMKLGPALKLRSVLTKKLGGPCPCVSCTSSINATSPSGSIPRPSSVESGT